MWTRAYKIICLQYRGVLRREHERAQRKRLLAGRADWRGLEPLEPRTLLSTATVLTELHDEPQTTTDAAIVILDTPIGPLEPVAPLGSLVYDTPVSDAISVAGETDTYTIDLDGGQTITVIATPAGGLQPRISVFDPNGAPIGVAGASGPGLDAVVQSVGAVAPGTYTVTISGDGGTFGAYTGRVILNAATENEGHDAATNDTAADAQGIDSSFLPLGLGSAERGAVLGTLAAVGPGSIGGSENFESGVLDGRWATFSSHLSGRIQVTGGFGASQGALALLMDVNSTSTLNLNEAVWTVDLTGLTEASLDFDHAEWNDEETAFAGDFNGHFNADGIAISDDGVRWHPVFNPTAQSSGVWVPHSIDLGAEALSAGMALGPNFKIKFQQYDDFDLPTDGRGYDDIRITVPQPAIDWYRFGLDDGESATLALSALAPSDLTLDLYDTDGTTLIARGTAAGDTDRIISDFVDQSDDGVAAEYLVRVTGPSSASDYSLVVTRGGDIDTESNNDIPSAQALDGGLTALGYLAGEPPAGAAGGFVDDSVQEIARGLIVPEPIGGAEHVPGRLIVRFTDQVVDITHTAAGFAGANNAHVIKHLPMINAAVITLDKAEDDILALAKRWSADPSVLYAEPDYLVHAIGTVPDDPDFSQLWGLHNTGQTGGTPDADIDAPEAWDRFRGSHSVVIASIDTGVDYTHPDLAANMWVNPGEIPGDGIDNDANGYIDDVHGIDTVNNDSDPRDDNRHGTHTAGTFGAVGNDAVGIVGVNWDVRIMALKFLSGGGSGSTSDAIEAVDYVTAMKRDHGVNVVVSNNSWGGGGFSQALRDSIEAGNDQGIMFVAAAGNSGGNTDLSPHYPSSYDLDGLIAVAATDHNDSLAGFSNFGAVSVDLGAPGVSVYSTTPGGGYTYLDGTSMASPHVAGVAGMLMANSPEASLAQIKAAILDTTDPVAGLQGRTLSGGRLNLSSALAVLGDRGDFYSFQANAGDALTIATLTPADGPLGFINALDPALELYDPTGTLVADDDNGAPDGRNAALAHTASTTGTYTVRVVSAADAGEYVVNVSGATGSGLAPTVAASIPADGQPLSVFPQTVTLDFSEALLAGSVDAADVMIGGLAALSYVEIDADTFEFQIDPAAQAGDAVYPVEVAANAVTDLQGQGNAAYAGTFAFDRSGPIILSTRWNGEPLAASGVTDAGSLTFQTVFDEAIREPGAEDVSLIDINTGAPIDPVSVGFDAATNTFTAQFESLAESAFALTLFSGDNAFEDLTGNDMDGEPLGPGTDATPSGDGVPGGSYSLIFATDIDVIAANEFVRLDPLGGLMFVSDGNAATLSGPGDEDGFEFFVEAGQTVSAIASPSDEAVTLCVELVGFSAPFCAPGPGEPVALPPQFIPADGNYEVRVGGDGSGEFELQIYRNASLEREAAGGNTDEVNPLAVDASLIPLGGDRYGVIGHSEPRRITIETIVWGVRPATGQIIQIDPVTGIVVDAYPAPDALGPGHSRIGLTIGEGGDTLLYVNSDLDPDALYRLDPASGAVLSIESLDGLTIDGLGYDERDQSVTVFSQDFESGLGPDESVSGAFTINNTNAPLNNGTSMLGHPGTYGNNEYSYYEVTLDLTAATGPVAMRFDYAANVEGHFDTINVQASVNPINPPGDLITPVSGLPYTDQGHPHRPELGTISYDGGGALDSGVAEFDLTPFAGDVVNVRIQFGSDGSVTDPGINIDNVEVVAVLPQDRLIFQSHGSSDIHRQSGFSGPQTSDWATGEPIGALGGDGAGRQFGYFADGLIHEYDPFTDTDSFINGFAPPTGDVEGMAFDGTHLFVSTASGDLITLDPDTGAQLNALPLPDGALFGLGAVRFASAAATTDLLINGGFETGTFTGWTAISNGRSELIPWTVGPAGGGYFAHSAPLSGSFDSLNGFDGAAGLEYELYQDVAIPDHSTATLTTNHRIVFDSLGIISGQDRVFEISIRDTNNNVLQPLFAQNITVDLAPFTDLGWDAQAFDVSAFSGQTVRVHFREFIPEDFTGPATIELDDISLMVEQGIVVTLPDIDAYTLDLTGRVGEPIDVIVAGQDGVDFSAAVLELLGTDGVTPLATAVPNPLADVGSPDAIATNYDMAILDFVVPADGVYTLRFISEAEGDYGLVVTTPLAFDTESNDELTDPLRSLDDTGQALGFLGSVPPVDEVLLFDESNDGYFQTALTSLGVEFELFTNFGAFDAAVADADATEDLLIVDAPGNNHPWARVISFVDSGGRAILEHWNLDSEPALAQAFDATVVADYFNPLPVFDWGGSPLFDGLPNPVNFIETSWNDDGDRLEPTGGAVAVGGFVAGTTTGQAALILGNGGNTLLNGFMLDNAASAAEAIRLAENEIALLVPRARDRFHATRGAHSTGSTLPTDRGRADVPGSALPPYQAPPGEPANSNTFAPPAAPTDDTAVVGPGETRKLNAMHPAVSTAYLATGISGAELAGQLAPSAIRDDDAGATGLEPITLIEAEPNDDLVTAEPVPLGHDFDRGLSPAVDVIGKIATRPGTVPTPIFAAEEDGAIPFATPTGLTGWPGSVTAAATIGDGVFGGTVGDYDWYSLFGIAAGQTITVDVDASDFGTGLDPVVGVYDSGGVLLAANDDSGGSLDSFLEFSVPATDDYFVVVRGYGRGFQDDPFNPGSGPGVGSVGDYEVTIGLDLSQTGDVDFFRVELAAGDILGANVDGAVTTLSLQDAGGIELIGSSQDVTYIHPASSPLPGGGNAALSWVVDTPGTYYVRAHGTDGAYTLNLRLFRPVLEDQLLGGHQILFLDFDGETIDPSIFGGLPGAVTLSALDTFLSGWGLDPVADLNAVIDAIVGSVTESLSADLRLLGNNGDFDATGTPGEFDIEILNSRDHADPFGQPNVSRVIIGGTIAELGIGTIGIAESIDVGNFETEESGVVLLDLLSAPAFDPNSLNQYTLAPSTSIIDLIGVGVGNIAVHEAGHFFANWHTDQFNALATLMDQGGNLGNILGLVGPVWGDGDETDVDFGPDTFVPNEGFTGVENTLNSIAFGLSTGLVDPAEVGPTVAAVDPPVGQIEDLAIMRVSVEFSETVSTASATDPANYELRYAGPNGVLRDGSGDDVIIAVTPVFDGDRVVSLDIDPAYAPLTIGLYELTIEGDSSIEDLDGNPLNSRTGPGGGRDHVHVFETIFNPRGGGDYYEISLTAGETLSVWTQTPFDNPLAGGFNDLDPLLIVFDPNGVPLALDDNSAPDGRNAQLDIVARLDGVYRVQVVGQLGTGEYLLNTHVVGVGQIEGVKWHDLDSDGELDDGEPGLVGWTIYLDLDNDGVLDPDEPFQITDKQGRYRFTGLEPGTYTVAEVPQAGWEQTSPTVQVVPWVEPTVQPADPADTVGDSGLGTSVAVDGDLAVVGVPFDDDNGTDSGAVFVYRRDDAGTPDDNADDTWNTEAKLTAADGRADDWFGYSVAVDGDTIVIGAHNDDDGGLNSGAAYVFTHDGLGWSQQAKLTAADAEAHDWFGYSVSVDGATIIIGAHNDDDKGFNSGAAYIFAEQGGAWTEQSKITAADGERGDWFGYSVAIDGDTIAIGAHRDDDRAVDSGAVYVFTADAGGWAEQAKLAAGDGAARDWFGHSVAIDGDTLVVGAHQDDVSGFNSGSVYVFSRDGLGWGPQAKLAADDGAARDWFGYSVAVDGDTIVIGAVQDDDGGFNAGSAYVYSLDGAAWTQQAKLTPGEGGPSNRFGHSVAVDGGVAAIGAHGSELAAAVQSAAQSVAPSGYVFMRNVASPANPQTVAVANDALVQSANFASHQVFGPHRTVRQPDRVMETVTADNDAPAELLTAYAPTLRADGSIDTTYQPPRIEHWPAYLDLFDHHGFGPGEALMLPAARAIVGLDGPLGLDWYSVTYGKWLKVILAGSAVAVALSTGRQNALAVVSWVWTPALPRPATT